MSEKPGADQVRQWIAAALERGRRANITAPDALADMVVRDLQARGVRLVWRPDQSVG